MSDQDKQSGNTENENNKKDNQKSVAFNECVQEVYHHKLSKEELVNRLEGLLESNEDIGNFKGEVELIRSHFYIKHNKIQKKALEEYLSGGGEEKDFSPQKDELELAFKALMKRYKEKKEDYFKRIGEEKEQNLKEKLQIIEDLKALTSSDEKLKKTFETFRSLQERWRNSGPVSHAEADTLWQNYHHHVENFYDYIRLNNELRDLDLKKNLEQKETLCKQVENMALDHKNPSATHDKLNHVFLEWREIGPVPKQQREEIWERFKAARKAVLEKIENHYKEQRQIQEENLAKKIVLCEKAEQLAEGNKAYGAKAWNKATNEILALQEEWKKVGFVPRTKSDSVFKRFRAACDIFFGAKRDFYKSYKDEQEKNLKEKIALCEQAESKQDSEDWKDSSHFYVELQKKWKKIGPVNRKQSDEVWNRFRTACNHFFDRKSEHFNPKEGSEQFENLAKKQEILAQIKAIDAKEPKAIAELSELREQWNKVGYVPFKEKAALYEEFRKTVDAFYSQAGLSKEERSKELFKEKLNQLAKSSGTDKGLVNELNKLIYKKKELNNELQLMENNILFFSGKNNPLNETMAKKIDGLKKKISHIESQIQEIDKLMSGE